MSLRNFLRRHVIADDPQPELSNLDRPDLDRSMADHPAGKRRPAVRPVPESVEEALSDDDLLAVARGAGVVREPLPESTAMALLYYEVTGDAKAAMGIFRTGSAA